MSRWPTFRQCDLISTEFSRIGIAAIGYGVRGIPEDELVGVFEHRAPHVIGNPYVVFGTVEKKRWKESLGPGGFKLDEALEHAADFKDVLGLKLESRWQPIK